MKNKNLIIILSVILIALVLRTPLTGVGAVMATIKESLGINNTVAGFITTLPLIAFAVVSPFVTVFSRKYGLEKILLFSTVLISIALLLRFYISIPVMFITTFLIGVGIAVGNVLMPAFVKKYYPEKMGVMTGVYTVLMTLGAAISSAVAYPIVMSNINGKEFSLGLALNIAVVLSVLAAILLLVLSKSSKVDKDQETEEKVKKVTNIFSNPKLYSITIFFGLQSAFFYSSVAWFGEIMIDKGFSNTEAGLLLSVSQFAQFPATFAMPILAEKIKNRLAIPLFIFICYFVSSIGLIFVDKNLTMILICIVLFAFAGGGSFSYVMYLFSAKTNNIEEASLVSGVAQSGGYLLAAIYPPVLGYIADVSSWSAALVLFVITSIVLLFAMIHISSKGNILK
ncbi:MAG: MFS transporter [Gemella sp.]|nr:MFS transporter [Gemella sp.]